MLVSLGTLSFDVDSGRPWSRRYQIPAAVELRQSLDRTFRLELYPSHCLIDGRHPHKPPPSLLVTGGLFSVASWWHFVSIGFPLLYSRTWRWWLSFGCSIPSTFKRSLQLIKSGAVFFFLFHRAWVLGWLETILFFGFHCDVTYSALGANCFNNEKILLQ